MENNSEHDTGLTSGLSAMPEPISVDDVASKLLSIREGSSGANSISEITSIATTTTTNNDNNMMANHENTAMQHMPRRVIVPSNYQLFMRANRSIKDQFMMKYSNRKLLLMLIILMSTNTREASNKT